VTEGSRRKTASRCH